MDEKEKTSNLISYPIIMLASNGDAEAINAVLRHFGDYINALSVKRLFDEDGNPYLFVDEGIRRRLETKLITAILSFNAA